MKYALDPTRLADLDRDGAHELGHAIRALRAQEASAADIDTLARRIASQLATPASVGAGAGGGGVAFGVGAKWIAGLLIAVAVAVAVGWYASMRPHAINPKVEQRALSASPRPNSAAAAVPSPLAPASEVVAEPVPAVAVANRVLPTAHRRSSARPAAVRSTATGAAESELALLERARAALDRDPSAALAFAEQHARAYPGGLFAQEREVLAIEALLKLRRRPAALQRASDFVQRYPDSPHARRMRELLDRSPHAPVPTTGAASDHSATGDSN